MYENCLEYADAYGMPQAINMGECPNTSGDGSGDEAAMVNTLMQLLGGFGGGSSSTTGTSSTSDDGLSIKDMLNFDAASTQQQSSERTTMMIVLAAVFLIVLIGFIILAIKIA